jgi:biopolymer transport protein ExbD
MAQVSTPGGRGKRRSIHLDMTPMVDLAFLLLTFFVLTMTLNGQFVLQVNKPKDDDKGEQQVVKRERVLTLLLDANDQIFYFQGDDPVRRTGYGPNGIRKLIQDSQTKHPKLVVLIKPTARSRYQNLVDIMDEVDIAKLQYYYLVKDTPEDRALIDAAR